MQKNNAFCSICTVNYSAYAATLSDSLKKVGHEEPYYVLVIDYEPAKHKEILDRFTFKPVFLSELNIPQIDEFIEKYSAFELSNVLKPFFLEWLLKTHKEVERLIYLDTDIYVYAPLEGIFDYLNKNQDISVAITQHLNDYESYSKLSDYKIEKSYMAHGLYNGGFYAIKNNDDSLQFLKWHKKKLSSYGYNGPSIHMYVDQKILDFAPLLFSYVGVYRNKAYNIAHWNYYPGLIQEKNCKYYVEKKKLVFFHFSQLKLNEQDVTNNFYFNVLSSDKFIFKQMVFAYWEHLKKNDYEKIIKMPYEYANRYKKPPTSLVSPISAKEAENSLIKIELNSVKAKLYSTKIELESTRAKLESKKTELESKKIELGKVYNSREWKAISKLIRVMSLIIPKKSYRRKIAVKSWRLVKMPLILTKDIRGKTTQLGNYLKKFKTRKKRKINLKSKKIVYIGHSYHAKTKSTAFLIDYLKKFYDVKIILDESWLGKPYPDVSFIDKSYLAVIFFQGLPDQKTLKNVKNDNLIFFPMYDGVRHDFEFWNENRNIKVINFSKTLHDKISRWGLQSIFIQYFPDAQKFQPGKNDEIFFWQRITKISIKQVARLFKRKKLKMHIHKAIDPNHKFIQPSRDEEKKFQITYSDWFETKGEMWDLIKQKGIYVAPRELEGIGMSFLEAMAMGKAVVAVDNPTMNEYIENGKTGYLFNLENPKPINFKNVDKVQKNAYDFMQKGHKKWQEDKKKIIDFIKKP